MGLKILWFKNPSIHLHTGMTYLLAGEALPSVACVIDSSSEVSVFL